MREDRESSGCPDDVNRLFARNAILVHICRPVGAQDDLVQLAKLACGVEREQRCALVAVVHDLKCCLAVFTQAGDLVVRQRGVPAIDVPHHIGAGFQHHVGIEILAVDEQARRQAAQVVDGSLVGVKLVQLVLGEVADTQFRGPCDAPAKRLKFSRQQLGKR